MPAAARLADRARAPLKFAATAQTTFLRVTQAKSNHTHPAATRVRALSSFSSPYYTTKNKCPRQTYLHCTIFCKYTLQ